MFSRSRRLPLVVALAILLAQLVATPAFAAGWTNTSLALSTSAPSATAVTHTFHFSGYSTSTVACVTMNWSLNSDGTGGAPPGFNVQNATWDNSSTWLTINGWNLNKTTSTLRATQQNGAAPSGSGDHTIVLTNITNGSTAGTTYYVQLKTFSDQNCTSNLQIDSATFAMSFSSGSVSASGSSLLTVQAGSSFTLVVDGYNSGSCNGSTITATNSSGTALPLGTVTPTSSAVGGQTLTVNSTGTGGYSVYVKYSDQLKDGSGHAIADHSGTNTSPTVMNAGTEGFGYTTDWTALNTANGSATRFSGGKWAGLSTTNQEIMYRSTGGASGDVAHACYQVNMSNATTNGAYSTTIVYTAVPGV